MGSVIPQWSLDKTSNDAFKVARGILEAATTDNVQPLALLACEKFGATVAMSPESCHKVHILCSRIHESAVLSFLKARIGYRKGDCSWHLAQSYAGLQFLGLAACLSTLNPWSAAIVLHRLIYATASDKTLIPTPQHLKQLVLAVEDPLAKSGFTESALGWSPIFLDEDVHSEISNDELSPAEKLATIVAPIDAVIGLTQAMSQLARVGERLQRIEIKTKAANAAWLVAFVKWCLGAPPAIVFHDGKSLTGIGDSPVVLRVLKNAQEIQVSLQDYTGKIENLVSAVPDILSFRGLVSVGAYGKAVMRNLFRNPQDLEYRACVQALPFACALALRGLEIRSVSSSRVRVPDDFDQWMRSETCSMRPKNFPTAAKICRVLHDYLGLGPEEAPKMLPEVSKVTRIQDLSLPSIIYKHTASKSGERREYGRFIAGLSKCAAHVLAVSLFNTPDPQGVQLYFSSDPHYHLIACIEAILQGSEFFECSVSDIFYVALSLLGHRVPSIDGWVMSTCYDQTVFPQILATQTTNGVDILALECIPGRLIFNGRLYNNVLVDPLCPQWRADNEETDASDTMCAAHETSDEQILDLGTGLLPRDAFPEFALEWQVGELEEALSVMITVSKFPVVTGRNPRHVLDAATESIFVNCSHDKKAKHVSNLAYKVYITNPLNPRPVFDDSSGVGIIESDGNENARFFTLATGKPAVVRLNSCLECCIVCSQFLGSGYAWIIT